MVVFARFWFVPHEWVSGVVLCHRCGDDRDGGQVELRPRGDPRVVLQQAAGAEEHHQETQGSGPHLLTITVRRGREVVAPATGVGRGGAKTGAQLTSQVNVTLLIYIPRWLVSVGEFKP